MQFLLDRATSSQSTGRAFSLSPLLARGIRASGVALALVLLAGCATPQGAAAPSGSVALPNTQAAESGQGASGPAASNTAGSGDSSQHWTTGSTEATSCDQVEQTLTGIRVGRHEGYDRVVFDLTGAGEPCFRVAYDPNPIQDGSGFPVDLGGLPALRVEIMNLGPEFPTIPPQYTAELSGPAVEFARFDTFFEGVATSFIAAAEAGEIEYAVSTMPGKLIVDVRSE